MSNTMTRIASLVRRITEGETITTEIIRRDYGVSPATAKRDLRFLHSLQDSRRVDLANRRSGVSFAAASHIPPGWAITKRDDIHPGTLQVTSPGTGPGFITLADDHGNLAWRMLHALCRDLLDGR